MPAATKQDIFDQPLLQFRAKKQVFLTDHDIKLITELKEIEEVQHQ